MAAVGEGAGATAKVLEVLKDLPLWLLAGIAGAAGLLLFVPTFAAAAPVGARPWVALGGVVFLSLAIARAVGLLVRWWSSWRASVAAGRRFHVTAFPWKSHWSYTRQSDDSIVTQISAEILVKNRTLSPLALVKARLIRPRIRGEILHDAVLVGAVEDDMDGTSVVSGFTIPPDMSLPARITLLIRGVPRRKLGRQVRAIIGVTDDEGHEERTAFNLCVLSPPQAVATTPTLEVVSSISDPIEKEIASVLQAELARYDKCNRTVGGLGSVHLAIQGREMVGVGTDSWNPNSPKNQSISDNPDAVELRSDNLNALLTLYERLPSSNEKDQFVAALLHRINKDKGYLPVTYFIVCVLWKTGKLSEALEKAKAELPQGEIKAFGLSNTLMMLNGLLRYGHPEFTTDMLDDIEKFVHGLREHPFQIPEKIAAIRAARLVGPQSSVPDASAEGGTR
jgi:hypothetical protein